MSAENERRQDLGLSVIPEAPEAPNRHGCIKGWLGETAEGLPVPCLTCRPWLGTTITTTRKA